MFLAPVIDRRGRGIKLLTWEQWETPSYVMDRMRRQTDRSSAKSSHLRSVMRSSVPKPLRLAKNQSWAAEPVSVSESSSSKMVNEFKKNGKLAPSNVPEPSRIDRHHGPSNALRDAGHRHIAMVFQNRFGRPASSAESLAWLFFCSPLANSRRATTNSQQTNLPCFTGLFASLYKLAITPDWIDGPRVYGSCTGSAGPYKSSRSNRLLISA